MPVQIRRTQDLDLIHKLDSRIFEGESAQITELARCVWWVAYDGKKPVAFAGARKCVTNPELVYFSRAGVLPCARGQGLQRRLIRTRLAWAKGHTAAITYTMPDNYVSSNNLIRCGFRMYKASWVVGGGVLYWWKDL